MEDSDSGNIFTIGFLFGALAGVAIGLTYAPRPGRETRDIIRYHAEALREKAGDISLQTRQAATAARASVAEKLKCRETG